MASDHRTTRHWIALATVSLATQLSAQSSPDVSGKWAVVGDAAPSGATQGSAPPTLSAQGNMGSGWPSEITLAQDAATLTLTFTYYHPRDVQPPIIFKYALDGSTSRNTIDLGRGNQEQVSKTTL